MGVTLGKIKGYISPEDIFNFIRETWDKNARTNVKKCSICPLSECDWEYEIHPHSEDNQNWCITSGFISFCYKDEARLLHYAYNNVNSFENLDYYSKHNLEDMVRTETTHIGLGRWGSSVEIASTLITRFGGGWIDEDDCDDEEYYEVSSLTLSEKGGADEACPISHSL